MQRTIFLIFKFLLCIDTIYILHIHGLHLIGFSRRLWNVSCDVLCLVRLWILLTGLTLSRANLLLWLIVACTEWLNQLLIFAARLLTLAVYFLMWGTNLEITATSLETEGALNPNTFVVLQGFIDTTELSVLFRPGWEIFFHLLLVILFDREDVSATNLTRLVWWATWISSWHIHVKATQGLLLLLLHLLQFWDVVCIVDGLSTLFTLLRWKCGDGVRLLERISSLCATTSITVRLDVVTWYEIKKLAKGFIIFDEILKNSSFLNFLETRSANWNMLSMWGLFHPLLLLFQDCVDAILEVVDQRLWKISLLSFRFLLFHDLALHVVLLLLPTDFCLEVLDQVEALE